MPAVGVHLPIQILGWQLGLIGSALAFLRWTEYRCPHCHAAFRRDYWPDNVRLGSGERTCNGCGKAFDDGAREWPELKWSRKLRYLLPPGIFAVGLSIFVFIGIAPLLLAPRDVVTLSIVVLLPLAALAPMFLWTLVRLHPIHLSRCRFENEFGSMRERLEVAGH
jgi:hypothetical protein